MKQIYNEGRVVGLSSYELYVKHHLSEFPSLPVLSEREWLAASVGNGSSMILRVASGTAAGIHDYPLPSDSLLCAPGSTVTASLFNGTVEIDTDGYWAIKVTSYGPLISNTSSSSPVSPGSKENVPSGNVTTWDNANINKLKEYLKIIDGVAFQPGEWTASKTEPAKDFKPNYTSQSIIRLRLSKALEEDVYILLHGFIHTPIVAGTGKHDSSPINPAGANNRPHDGDFLGAAIFPWASKIIFTVPNEVMNVLQSRMYTRELPDGGKSKSVDSTPLIDFDSTDPSAYYSVQNGDSNIALDVKDINVVNAGVSVLGTYQREDKTSGGYKGTNYPPVLYGAKVTKTGVQTMSPVDIAAPGTVKVFESKDLAINYPKVIPNVFSLYKDDSTGDIFIIDKDTTENDLVPITTKVKTENFGTTGSPKYAATIRARNEAGNDEATVSAISLLDPNGNKLNTDGTSTSILDATTNLNWTTLLKALDNNQKIELLGEVLRTFRGNLPNIKTSGVLDLSGTGTNKLAGALQVAKDLTVKGSSSVTGNHTVAGNATVGGSLTVNGGTDYNALTDDTEFKFNKPIKSGANYITLNNGLRLYISSTAPSTSGVPVGSIGIGW